jgi:membrane associated rhomboid family serine protease
VGNLLFLWIFGDNVEDNFGRGPYLLFYLLCGVAATLAQYFTDPLSRIPNLGASGAISGVLGAYIVLYPVAAVRLFVWPFSLFIGTFPLPAFLWIGIWFLMQLVPGIQALGQLSEGGVAFWAHIGGFIAGLALIWLFRRRPPRERSTAWR